MGGDFLALCVAAACATQGGWTTIPADMPTRMAAATRVEALTDRGNVLPRVRTEHATAGDAAIEPQEVPQPDVTTPGFVLTHMDGEAEISIPVVEGVVPGSKMVLTTDPRTKVWLRAAKVKRSHDTIDEGTESRRCGLGPHPLNPMCRRITDAKDVAIAAPDGASNSGTWEGSLADVLIDADVPIDEEEDNGPASDGASTITASHGALISGTVEGSPTDVRNDMQDDAITRDVAIAALAGVSTSGTSLGASERGPSSGASADKEGRVAAAPAAIEVFENGSASGAAAGTGHGPECRRNTSLHEAWDAQAQAVRSAKEQALRNGMASWIIKQSIFLTGFKNEFADQEGAAWSRHDLKKLVAELQNMSHWELLNKCAQLIHEEVTLRNQPRGRLQLTMRARAPVSPDYTGEQKNNLTTATPCRHRCRRLGQGTEQLATVPVAAGASERGPSSGASADKEGRVAAAPAATEVFENGSAFGAAAGTGHGPECRRNTSLHEARDVQAQAVRNAKEQASRNKIVRWIIQQSINLAEFRKKFVDQEGAAWSRYDSKKLLAELQKMSHWELLGKCVQLRQEQIALLNQTRGGLQLIMPARAPVSPDNTGRQKNNLTATPGTRVGDRSSVADSDNTLVCKSNYFAEETDRIKVLQAPPETVELQVPDVITPGVVLTLMDGEDEISIPVVEGVVPGSKLVLTKDPRTKVWSCAATIFDEPAPTPLAASGTDKSQGRKGRKRSPKAKTKQTAEVKRSHDTIDEGTESRMCCCLGPHPLNPMFRRILENAAQAISDEVNKLHLEFRVEPRPADGVPEVCLKIEGPPCMVEEFMEDNLQEVS